MITIHCVVFSFFSMGKRDKDNLFALTRNFIDRKKMYKRKGDYAETTPWKINIEQKACRRKSIYSYLVRERIHHHSYYSVEISEITKARTDSVQGKEMIGSTSIYNKQYWNIPEEFLGILSYLGMRTYYWKLIQWRVVETKHLAR